MWLAAMARPAAMTRRCALLTAEQLAPEEVRYQPAARALVAELLHREPAGPKRELRALAERVGAVA
jgi:hypothetical protein